MQSNGRNIASLVLEQTMSSSHMKTASTFALSFRCLFMVVSHNYHDKPPLTKDTRLLIVLYAFSALYIQHDQKPIHCHILHVLWCSVVWVVGLRIKSLANCHRPLIPIVRTWTAV